MRAMRNLTLSIVSCAVLAVGCGSSHVMPDMSIAHDMTLGPDLAMRVPDGVACGTNVTCPVGKSCCVSFANNMATGAMCIDPTGQCMGAVLACDGPEDCNMSATDACCATINLTAGGPDAAAMVTGGNSKCGQCKASLNPTSGAFMTRLCHVPSDCKNFSLVFGTFNVPFNKCCSNGMTGGVQFCAPDPSAVPGGMGGGYTCQ
jgi:hypothetical protein